jgi:hypothetical protein
MLCCAIELSATSTLDNTSNPVANVFILLLQPFELANDSSCASHEIAPSQGDPQRRLISLLADHAAPILN